MEKLPPQEKVCEAWSALIDGRVSVSGSTAEVVSSNGEKTYHLKWRDGLLFSDDNSTYWQGYAGYPVIAVLMHRGLLPYDEGAARLFSGIDWHAFNKRHKRDYAAAVSEVLAEAPDQDRADIERSCRQVLEALSTLDLTLTRKRTL